MFHYWWPKLAPKCSQRPSIGRPNYQGPVYLQYQYSYDFLSQSSYLRLNVSIHLDNTRRRWHQPFVNATGKSHRLGNVMLYCVLDREIAVDTQQLAANLANSRR